MISSPAPAKPSDYFLPTAIALIVLAVFSPVLWHDFINYDDDVFVFANPNVTSGITLESLRWAFTTAHEVNWIPLTWISHMLDIELFGLNPAGHHAVNVVIHAASSALLFQFFKRTTGLQWQSAAVALLFALHPLHVESVAWVAERKDVLSAFFGMLTLCAYARYARKPGTSAYLLTLFLFLLGLLSKPMLVTLPLVLLLLDWWPLGRISQAEGTLYSQWSVVSRLFVEKIPFLVLSACSSIITYLVQRMEGELVQGYTLLSRSGKACIAYVSYLHKMLWPVDLAVIYPFSKYPPSSAKIAASAGFLILASVIVVWFGRRLPYLVTGWFWYMVTLLPVIGLIQIGQHSVADRYTYIPLIGIFIMATWGVAHLLAGWKSRQIILCGLSLFCITAMIVLTTRQLKHWENGYTVFSRAVEVTEGNWVALNNLGMIFLKEGKVDDAIHFFKESVRAKPSFVLAYVNLGFAYQTKNELDAAVDAFTWALRLDPGNPGAVFSLGQIYTLKGDRRRAFEAYQVLEKTGPDIAPKLLELINAASPAGTTP